MSWHYFVHVCFHLDIKEGFFCNVLVKKSQISLTMAPFIKAVRGENI